MVFLVLVVGSVVACGVALGAVDADSHVDGRNYFDDLFLPALVRRHPPAPHRRQTGSLAYTDRWSCSGRFHQPELQRWTSEHYQVPRVGGGVAVVFEARLAGGNQLGGRFVGRCVGVDPVWPRVLVAQRLLLVVVGVVGIEM